MLLKQSLVNMLSITTIQNAAKELEVQRPEYLLEKIYYGMYEQWCTLAASLLGTIGTEKTRTFIGLQLRKYIANNSRFNGYKLVAFDDITKQQAEQLKLNNGGFYFILRKMTPEELQLTQGTLDELDFRWTLEIPFNTETLWLTQNQKLPLT